MPPQLSKLFLYPPKLLHRLSAPFFSFQKRNMGRSGDAIRSNKLAFARGRTKRDERTVQIKAERRAAACGSSLVRPAGGALSAHGAVGPRRAQGALPSQVTEEDTAKPTDADGAAAKAHAMIVDAVPDKAARAMLLQQAADAIRVRSAAGGILAYLRHTSAAHPAKALSFAVGLMEQLNKLPLQSVAEADLDATADDDDDDGEAEASDANHRSFSAALLEETPSMVVAALLRSTASLPLTAASGAATSEHHAATIIVFLQRCLSAVLTASMGEEEEEKKEVIAESPIPSTPLLTSLRHANHSFSRDVVIECLRWWPLLQSGTMLAAMADPAPILSVQRDLAGLMCELATQTESLLWHRHGSRVLLALLDAVEQGEKATPTAGAAMPTPTKKGTSKKSASVSGNGSQTLVVPRASDLLTAILAPATSSPGARLPRLIQHPIAVEVAMSACDRCASSSSSPSGNRLSAAALLKALLSRTAIRQLRNGDALADEPSEASEEEGATEALSAAENTAKRGKAAKRPRGATESTADVAVKSKKAVSAADVTSSDAATAAEITEALILNKRWNRFLRHLLDVTLANVRSFGVKEAIAVIAQHFMASTSDGAPADDGSSLVQLAEHGLTNFLLQSLIQRCVDVLSCAATADSTAATSTKDPAISTVAGFFSSRAAGSLVAQMDRMMLHPIAAYPFGSLCAALATAAALCASPSSSIPTAEAKLLKGAWDRLASQLKQQLIGLATHKHASLSLRRLITDTAAPSAAASVDGAAAPSASPPSAVAAVFLQTLLTALPPAESLALCSHEFGNLVIQTLLRGAGGGGAAHRDAFIKAVIAPAVVDLSQHPYGAHVVIAALEVAPPALHMALYAALKPHITSPLATHLNGRFVVQALVRPHKECRDKLTAALGTLALATGTQHLFAEVYKESDATGRSRLAQAVASCGVERLATSQAGSMVLQRLLEVDAQQSAAGGGGDVLAALKTALANDGALRRRLEADFFGKYVIAFLDPAVARRLQERSRGGAPASGPSRGSDGHRGGRGGRGGGGGRSSGSHRGGGSSSFGRGRGTDQRGRR